MYWMNEWVAGYSSGTKWLTLKLKLAHPPTYSFSNNLLSACYVADICTLCLSIHLLSGGSSCCGVSSNGLGTLSKSSDCSDCLWLTRLSSIPLHPSLTANTMVVQLRALNCLLDDPLALSQEKASVLLLLIQAQTLLLLVSQKSSSPHVPIHPGLPWQLPTHTCKSRSHSVGFIIAGLKASSWTGAADSKREQGKSLVAHKLPLPPPPSCLFCRWVSVKESLCAFPGVDASFTNGAARAGGCNSLLWYIIDLSSWWW